MLAFETTPGLAAGAFQTRKCRSTFGNLYLCLTLPQLLLLLTELIP